MKPFLKLALLVVTVYFFVGCQQAFKTNTSENSVLPQSEEMEQVGDMILYKSSLSLRTNAGGGFQQYRVLLWEKGILPLKFSETTTPADKNLVLESCREWERVAPVRCIEHTTEAQYLVINRSSDPFAANSSVGRSPNGTYGLINIGEARFYKDIIIHELGHAFGLLHEHQRSDRDQYIDVRFENISDSALSQYRILSSSENPTAYDFLSIMHYSPGAGVKMADGSQAFYLKAGYERYEQEVGNQLLPSVLDGQGLTKLYENGTEFLKCSVKSKELVRRAYRSIFWREATTAEVEGNCLGVESSFDSGLMTLSNKLLAAPEHKATTLRVKRYGFVLYFVKNFLARELTANEYARWVTNKSVPYANILNEIFFSQEFSQLVATMLVMAPSK